MSVSAKPAHLLTKYLSAMERNLEERIDVFNKKVEHLVLLYHANYDYDKDYFKGQVELEILNLLEELNLIEEDIEDISF